jgi:hypothetical protein
MVGATIGRTTSKSSGQDEAQEPKPELTTKDTKRVRSPGLGDLVSLWLNAEVGVRRTGCVSVLGVHNQRMRHERNRGALVLLLVAVAALDCHKPDYFPLKDNQVWRYAATGCEVRKAHTIEAESLTYAIAVTGSAVEPGLGRVYEVRITRDDEPCMSLFFRKTRDALFVLPASHLDGFEPTSGWVKLLELPLREGTFWYGDAEHSVSFEVTARDSVEVPAGRFRDCFRIRVHAPNPYVTDLWLAPDAGIIRWQRTLSAVRSENSVRIRR